MSFGLIFLNSSFTSVTYINSFPFSPFLRHGNLVLTSFRISDMFFSISFSYSSSSSLILKTNSTFSCRLPISSTTTLTSFKNISPLFSSKLKNYCSSSLSLSFGTWLCSSSSIILCISSVSNFINHCLLIWLCWSIRLCSVILKIPLFLHIAFIRCWHTLIFGLLL